MDRGSAVDDHVTLSQNTPAVGQYQAVDPSLYKQHSLVKFARQSSPTRRFDQIKVTDARDYAGSLQAYKYANSTNLRYTSAKEPKFSEAEREAKKRAKNPAPGQYSPSYKNVSLAPSGSITARRR